MDVNALIRGISYFLGLFNPMFRLLEKATITLLAFSRTLYAYLASLCPQLSLLMNWHPNFLIQFMENENISNMKMNTLFMLSVLDAKNCTIFVTTS